jgi:acyl-CoA thioesterase
MLDIKEYFKRDQYAKHSNIKLIDASLGYAKAVMEIQKFHMNSINTIHGGAIFTLADFVFAVASNYEGTVVTGVNMDISYVKAGEGKTLTAVAKAVSAKGKLVSYIVHVTDDQDDIIAVFKGLGYTKKITLEEVAAQDNAKK